MIHNVKKSFHNCINLLPMYFSVFKLESIKHMHRSGLTKIATQNSDLTTLINWRELNYRLRLRGYMHQKKKMYNSVFRDSTIT